MALTSADLLDPKGPIQREMFPLDTPIALATRLDSYIADGEARSSALVGTPEQDFAVYHYGLYKAYEAVYLLMLARPAKIDLNEEGGSAYLPEQIEGMRQQMMMHKEAFEGLLPGTYVARENVQGTGSTLNRYIM